MTGQAVYLYLPCNVYNLSGIRMLHFECVVVIKLYCNTSSQVLSSRYTGISMGTLILQLKLQ